MTDFDTPDFSRLAPKPGSTVLVIGGCGGIGYALVRTLQAQQCRAVVMDLDSALARREARSDGLDDVTAIAVDLRDEASVLSAFASLSSLDITLDGIAICSGYTKGHDPVSALDTPRFDDVLAGNLRGPALAIREAIPLVATHAAIVLLSTGIGQIGAPGYAGYGAAKAGLNALTRILAAELAPNIRVNGVAPGAVDTAFIRGGYGDGAEETGPPARFNAQEYNAKVPMGRMAVSGDVVGPLLFLLSESARYITGQVLHVNGGAFMRD